MGGTPDVGGKRWATYIGSSKKQRLTKLCRRIDARSGCGGLFRGVARHDEAIAGSWPSRPDLGERWPSLLVATAAEDRLSIKRNLYTSFA
jgi:hypothetical protein